MRKFWWELLPAPFNKNPNVLLVMAPTGTKVHELETSHGQRIMCLEVGDTKRGLNVLSPKLKTVPEHLAVFDSVGVDMMDPVYVGKLNDLPQEWLLKDELIPLLFVRDEMYRPFLQLRSHMKTLSKEKNGSN